MIISFSLRFNCFLSLIKLYSFSHVTLNKWNKNRKKIKSYNHPLNVLSVSNKFCFVNQVWYKVSPAVTYSCAALVTQLGKELFTCCQCLFSFEGLSSPGQGEKDLASICDAHSAIRKKIFFGWFFFQSHLRDFDAQFLLKWNLLGSFESHILATKAKSCRCTKALASISHMLSL